MDQLLKLCEEFKKPNHILPAHFPIGSLDLLQQILDACDDAECPICVWKDGCPVCSLDQDVVE